MKGVVLSLLVFSVLYKTSAQTLMFEKRFGGTSDDISFDNCFSGNGGYAVIGWSGSFSNGGNDYYLVKTDDTGNSQWSFNYGSTQNDSGMSIFPTSDNGYVIGGTQVSGVTGDCWILKLNASGIFQWETFVGGGGDDYIRDIAQTTDGGYIFTGFTDSEGNGLHDVFVGKLSSTGSLQWTQTIGGPANDESWSIIETNDGGFLIGAWTKSIGSGMSDAYLIKLNSTGSILWSQTFGGINDDAGMSVMETSDNNYLLVGNTRSEGNGLSDVLVVKVNTAGGLIWENTFGSNGEDYGRSVVETFYGYVVVGYTNSYGAGGDDVYLVNIDFQGNQISYQTYGQSANDQAWKVRTDGQSLLVSGSTYSNSAGGMDMYFLKLRINNNDIFENLINANIYPNPSNGEIKLSSNTLFDRVQIIDDSGRIIQDTKVSSTLDYSLFCYKPGTFIVKLIKGSEVVSSNKIVITQ